MVGPGGVAEIDGGLSGKEFREKEAAQMDCSCARDGLHGVRALLRDGGRVGAEDELGSSSSEVGEAGDGEVFVVEGGVVAEDLVGLEAG